MRTISADDLERLLGYPALVDSLRDMFRAGCEMPTRHHHTVKTPSGEGTLLLMPAWQVGAFIGVKIVTIFGENLAKGMPSVLGQYLLLDAATGEPRALIDGAVLTRWRTGAASALAADYLARTDAKRMLMVGSGTLAPYLIRAHASVRPIEEVRIWSRNATHAQAVAKRLAGAKPRVAATRDLEESARWADLISCATLSTEPLIKGDWLTPGAHLDLVGAYRADMRESDDQAIARADLFVDTRGGAMGEAGDVLQAIASGTITEADIRGDLYQLCRGDVAGREDETEITAFKSVGAALEDLAAARLAYEQAGGDAEG